MNVIMVTSLNRHRTQEITYHFTPTLAEFEMQCRALCGHNAIQSREIVMQFAPWGCEVQPKPGKRREREART